MMMIGLAFYASYELGIAQDRGLPYTSVVNLTMDVVGMAICVILFATTLFDQRISLSTIFFMSIIVLECLLLMWDFEAWIIDGIPEKATFNKIVNYYVYGFIGFVMIGFWLYLKQLLDIKTQTLRYIDLAYYIIFAAYILLLMSNVVTHDIFTVDPDTGRYHRGDGYVLTLISPALMIILNAFVTFRYVRGWRKKVPLYAYTALPMMASILQSMFFGIGILYISILFSLVLIYSNFYVERGKEIVKKDTMIFEQRIAIVLSQIQPEFLDKALNNIAGMEGNPPETREALIEFASYMKSNLDSFGQTEAIPFSKEMDHVRTYLDLEKLRFKERLTVELDVRDTDFQIPALTLQMLVENAIKHGITTKESGGTVSVKTEETDTDHVITVLDDGVGFDINQAPRDEGRSHIGLTNVRSRLAEMVGGRLEIESEIGRGTRARVVIPKNNKINE